jgi:hypothetical protein
LIGDDLMRLLGLGAEEAPVQECLERLARGRQPELDPEDEENYVDWITLNELGLELGFEDEAYVCAWPQDLRRKGRLLLSQLYFYGETPQFRQYPYPLPFGLSFVDDRSRVRANLASYEATRRSYIRDFWRLPAFGVTIAYRQDNQTLESIYCQLPYAPWLPREGEGGSLTPDELKHLFGLRWSSVELRSRLAVLGLERQLGDVRRERVADLRREHGIELYFSESRKVPVADQRYPRALAFSAVTYYAARELDSRRWAGPLPFGLSFDDTQHQLRAKMRVAPSVHSDDTLSGLTVWHFEDCGIAVTYSNLENRLLRVTFMTPGFWS